MVKFNRYEEFNDGKIKISVPAFEDEKELYGDDVLDLELIITAKQAQALKGMVDTYDALVQIMEASYPNMKKESREAFLIRHADQVLEEFMIWSGVPKEKLDEFKKLQETLIKDFMDATPEERKKFVEDKIKSKNDNNSKSR